MFSPPPSASSCQFGPAPHHDQFVQQIREKETTKFTDEIALADAIPVNVIGVVAHACDVPLSEKFLVADALNA
jgi:hypothetical protein